MFLAVKTRLATLTSLRSKQLGVCPELIRHISISNEPLLEYKDGSPERIALDQTLEKYQNNDPQQIKIIIGDEELTCGEIKEQVSPFNHKKVVARFYYADENLIKRAISQCLEARPKWERTPAKERRKIFLKAADLVSKSYRPDIVATTMLGQGKTIYQAEIDAAAELADFLRFNSHFSKELSKYVPISTGDASNKMRFRGMEGFWAAVTPFNFTAIGGNLASAPAIVGNVVVWKPTDTAMLSNYTVYKILREAGLPPNIINFVPSDGPLFGDTITSHPDLAGINFTGSVATFRRLYKQVGQNIDIYKTFPRLIGECGGKNYHFVHPSADPDVVANTSIRSAFEFSGQKCSACSRMYVPESLWPDVKNKMLEIHSQLKLDSPLIKETFMSAVIDDKAYQRVKAYIDHAKSNGKMQIIAGGNCDDSKGYFVEPTIIENSDPLDKIMQEEIFGPVVTAYVYPDSQLRETLELVKTTSPFGLTGAIFTKDELFRDEAIDYLKESAGNFYVNNPSTGSVVGQQPFGGARLSGTNDKAGGPHYMLKFVSPQSIKFQHKPIVDWKQAHMK